MWEVHANIALILWNSAIENVDKKSFFFPTAVTPACAAVQRLSESVPLLRCNINEQCDTAHCNVTNPYVQIYISMVMFTIMPCNLPPAVRISGKDLSGEVLLDRVLSQLQNTFPLQRGVTVSISVSQLDNAIGIEVSIYYARY